MYKKQFRNKNPVFFNSYFYTDIAILFSLQNFSYDKITFLFFTFCFY